MVAKSILRIANTVQALNLAKHNIKESGKKQSVKSITKLGLGNILGTSMVKLNAELIESL